MLISTLSSDQAVGFDWLASYTHFGEFAFNSRLSPFSVPALTAVDQVANSSTMLFIISPPSSFLWLPPVSLTLWYLCSSNAQVWLVEFAVPALSREFYSVLCNTQPAYTLLVSNTIFWEGERNTFLEPIVGRLSGTRYLQPFSGSMPHAHSMVTAV